MIIIDILGDAEEETFLSGSKTEIKKEVFFPEDLPLQIVENEEKEGEKSLPWWIIDDLIKR